jgi:formylglycine-generating enzyme
MCARTGLTGLRLVNNIAHSGSYSWTPMAIRAIFVLAAVLVAPLQTHGKTDAAALVMLSQPGPWADVSRIIGFNNRVWFVNSVKFRNHNSADVYSYDPIGGQTRYERHLFSQDAGDPVVADGILYWPFEDSRFSAGRGEYALTDGQRWQWRLLPQGEVFHLHAMAAVENTLYAATSAWRGGLQRSTDGGETWTIVYDHPTPENWVGALTALTGERFGYDKDAWRRWWSADRGMIRVPAGNLVMGSDAGEPAEAPPHDVAISSFTIDRFEVTNAEFSAFVESTGYQTSAERSGYGWHWTGTWQQVNGADWRHPRGPRSSIRGLDRHPVVQVSWRDADAYCRWRQKRLPTEAEWERAARGPGGRDYAWGDTPPGAGGQYRASYGSDACCQPDDSDGFLHTSPVGSFPDGRSAFEVEDMTGNVWEWVRDTFAEDYYARSPSRDPVNIAPGPRKVIRGGGWGNNPWGLRTTLRHANPPDIGLSMVGIRCASDGFS